MKKSIVSLTLCTFLLTAPLTAFAADTGVVPNTEKGATGTLDQRQGESAVVVEKDVTTSVQNQAVLERGDLLVKLQIQAEDKNHPAPQDKALQVTVALYDKDDKALAMNLDYYQEKALKEALQNTSVKAAGQIKNGSMTFLMKDGEGFVIRGIPEGTKYVVTPQAVNEKEFNEYAFRVEKAQGTVGKDAITSYVFATYKVPVVVKQAEPKKEVKTPTKVEKKTPAKKIESKTTTKNKDKKVPKTGLPLMVPVLGLSSLGALLYRRKF